MTGLFQLLVKNLWLGAALLGIAVFMLAMGPAAWLVAMRHLVPAGYLRYHAVDLETSPILQWLVRWIVWEKLEPRQGGK